MPHMTLMPASLLSQERQENLTTRAVDTAQGVISPIQADFAPGRDSPDLPNLTEQVQSRLLTDGLYMQDLLADTG
ncbi:hypothetical protein K3G39_19740 [Pontibacter sp. HSC-14F20]|uniref:hypothetical protein n=1 Tax=Pontibacter sp. HSC-14F20 TaxID=2864136 RepID=UPI001C736714|nr:hypothetical protein [Pontibacter sp. HSC-14F20]MBX0335473.1 hypothetical protein [Pontibacter sp. HSC-14F20]